MMKGERCRRMRQWLNILHFCRLVLCVESFLLFKIPFSPAEQVVSIPMNHQWAMLWGKERRGLDEGPTSIQREEMGNDWETNCLMICQLHEVRKPCLSWPHWDYQYKVGLLLSCSLLSILETLGEKQTIVTVSKEGERHPPGSGDPIPLLSRTECTSCLW